MTDEFDERRFQKVVTEGLIPKIEGSSAAVAICPTGDIDAKFCVELGAMIMLDKPILAIIHPSRSVPEKLRTVADAVVVADVGTKHGQLEVKDAIEEFLKEQQDR